MCVCGEHARTNEHAHALASTFAYAEKSILSVRVAGSSILKGQDQKTRREKDAKDQLRPHSAEAFIPHGDSSPGRRFHLCMCVNKGRSMLLLDRNADRQLGAMISC
jgi:hypothetical protein